MEQVAHPSAALRLWRSSGALGALIPSLANVSDLTLASVDALAQPRGSAHPERRINRITALFAENSPRDAERAMKALHGSNTDGSWMREVLERWQKLEAPLRESLAPGTGAPSAEAVRRWVALTGRLRVGSVMRIAAARFAAERAAGGSAPEAKAVADLYRRMSRAAFRDPVELGDLAVDGDDLRSAGIPAGPELGKILQRLLDWVLEDPTRNTREILIARVSQGG